MRLKHSGDLRRVHRVEVVRSFVTAELFDQAMARLARKRVPVLESTPEPVVEHVLTRLRPPLERRCDVPMVLDNPWVPVSAWACSPTAGCCAA